MKSNIETNVLNNSKFAPRVNLLTKHELNNEVLHMHRGRLEYIIKNLRDTIKELNIQDGEIINLSDEHHRVMVSPYRLTMELRFPDGLNGVKK